MTLSPKYFKHINSFVDLSGKQLKPHHVFLAGELSVHQGCVRDEALQDGRVDGEC